MEIAPLTPNTVALSASQSAIFRFLWRDARKRPVFEASLLLRVTGESSIGVLVGRSDEFLSASR